MGDARGYFALRGIHNCTTADGNGKDWFIFGDPGYRNGRLTPKAKDEGRCCVHIPAQKVNRSKMPRCQPAHHKRSGSLPTFDGSKGASFSLRPAVRERWQRTHVAPIINEPGRRCTPAQPDFPVKRAPDVADPNLQHEEAAFKKAVEARLFQTSTFPVPKYRCFSQPAPYVVLDGLGEHVEEPPVRMPKLPPPPVERYRTFSCPAFQRSCSFIAEQPHHGLRETKLIYDSR